MSPLAEQFVSHLRLVGPRDPGAGDPQAGRGGGPPTASLPAPQAPLAQPVPTPWRARGLHPSGRHRLAGEPTTQTPAVPGYGIDAGPPSRVARGGGPQTTPTPRGRGTGVEEAGRAQSTAMPRAHPARLTRRGRRLLTALRWTAFVAICGFGGYLIGACIALGVLLYGPH